MREQDARTDPFKPVTTAIGSGPFRFLPGEYVLGVGAAWEKNRDYVPRAEPPSAHAGGKVVHLDRVELKAIPDAATRGNAIIKGEIDFIDQLPADMVPLLQRDRNVVVSKLSPLASVSYLRPNQLFPPFDNIKARQALALSVNQADYMAAGYGTPEWWKPACFSFFGCDTDNGTEAGAEPYRQQNLERARALLKESGYDGTPIVLVGTTELPAQQALAQPLTNVTINTACDQKNYFGWPCDEAVERLRAEYAAEPDPGKRRAKLDELSRALWAALPTIPTGNYYSPFAWRKEIKGLILASPLVFWNIDKN
jgi:peptide/nickel transport system substrate-binding protein